MQNTVHFVLQAKGGIGKSFVSTLLAQHLINETGVVKCFDTAYIHTIVGGGDTLADTAHGFHAIAQKIEAASLVLWLNEHFGEIKTEDGRSFTETQGYRESVDRLVGTVTLYKRNSAIYGEDIRKLNTKRHTIVQALESPDYSLMEKQRIKTFSRDIFGQLNADKHRT